MAWSFIDPLGIGQKGRVKYNVRLKAYEISQRFIEKYPLFLQFQYWDIHSSSFGTNKLPPQQLTGFNTGISINILIDMRFRLTLYKRYFSYKIWRHFLYCFTLLLRLNFIKLKEAPIYFWNIFSWVWYGPHLTYFRWPSKVKLYWRGSEHQGTWLCPEICQRRFSHRGPP